MQPSPPAHVDVLPEVKCEIGPRDWDGKVMSAGSSEGDVGGHAVFNVVDFGGMRSGRFVSYLLRHPE